MRWPKLRRRPVETVEAIEVLVQVRYQRKRDGIPVGTHVLPVCTIPAHLWPSDRPVPLMIADEVRDGQVVRSHLEWETLAAIAQRVAAELAHRPTT